ncbi:hypothetical protein JL720_7510 [Aureococcus anophagefferens]|nr:hypothetical protein JL720_7510 [Aureococcus anophagefferens]
MAENVEPPVRLPGMGDAAKPASLGARRRSMVVNRDIQKAVFTRWVNNRLGADGSGEAVVEDLYGELRDGVVLCALLKALGMDPFSRGGPDRRRGEVYHMGNLSMAFKAIDKAGVKVVNIGVRDVYDGKPDLILALVWGLVCATAARGLAARLKRDVDGAARVVRRALLDWAQELVEGFDDLPRPGQDKRAKFQTSKPDISAVFHSPRLATTDALGDGRVFLAILHACDPRRHAYDPTGDGPRDCATAFDRASDAYGVPRLLAPGDVADGNACLTYVSALQPAVDAAHAAVLRELVDADAPEEVSAPEVARRGRARSRTATRPRSTPRAWTLVAAETLKKEHAEALAEALRSKDAAHAAATQALEARAAREQERALAAAAKATADAAAATAAPTKRSTI